MGQQITLTLKESHTGLAKSRGKQSTNSSDYLLVKNYEDNNLHATKLKPNSKV